MEIKINNHLGNYLEYIICKGEIEIGRCSNLLSIYDVLCQIKQKNLSDYYLIIKGNDNDGKPFLSKHKINKDGRITPLSFKNCISWMNILDKQLLYLSGFTNNFIYENRI